MHGELPALETGDFMSSMTRIGVDFSQPMLCDNFMPAHIWFLLFQYPEAVHDAWTRSQALGSKRG
jgi:hypothetical protein